MGFIYITTNLINGKQYIGQTIRSLQKRRNCHFTDIKRTNLPFHNALKKYGKENFRWVSFECPIENLDYSEVLLIKELNTLKPNGYNLTEGGKGVRGWHHTEKTKEKLSNINKDKIFSEEHKNNISKGKRGCIAWNKGIPWIEEIKQKIRDNQPDQSGANNNFYGKNHSIKSKEKNRIAHLNKYNGEDNPSSKLTESQVKIIKKYLKEGFLKGTEIAKKFNVKKSTISSIKLNKSWKYIEMENRN